MSDGLKQILDMERKPLSDYLLRIAIAVSCIPHAATPLVDFVQKLEKCI